MPEFSNPLMCDLCYKDGIELGRITAGFSLIFWQDKYHILMSQGHNGDIFFTFSHKPVIDPDPDCVHNEALPGEKEYDLCVDELWAHKASMMDAYQFIANCKNSALSPVAWDGVGSFDHWLVDRCGKMIAEHGAS